MFKGKLEAFWETGSEGIHWFLYLDGKEGYDALYSIEEGDYITIYNEENDIIYESDIIKDRFSNWRSYPMNPLIGQQVAGNYWVHWLQANVEPELWSRWFHKAYRATIKKSILTEVERENIKNKIKDDYYKNRVFKKVLLEKSQLNLSLIEPEFYGEKGEIALIDMLLSANNQYQIFDDKYYTIINIEDKNDCDLKNISLEDIKKENFSEINIIPDDSTFNEFNKLLDFSKNISKNYSKHLDIMFGKVEDKEYIEKFEKNQKDSKILKSKLGKIFLEQLKETESYKIKNNVIKLIKFSKKTTEILRKDK